MNICHHGNISGRCRVCELEAEVNRLTAERDELVEALRRAHSLVYGFEDTLNRSGAKATEIESQCAALLSRIHA